MLKDDYGFEEFEDVSLQDWKELIAGENGGDLPDEFIWKVSSGVEISPFHHRGSRSNLVKNNEDWLFANTGCHQLVWEENDNKKIHDNLLNGADGIIIKFDDRFDFDQVLAGVYADSCHLCFSTGDVVAFHSQYHDWLSKQQMDIAKVNGLLLPDLTKPIGKSTFIDYRHLLSGFKRVEGVKSIPLHLTGIGVEGLTPEKELALLCAQMVDCISTLADAGYKLDDIVGQMFLNLPIGDTFYLEIAKIKSLKLLTALVLSQYDGLKEEIRLPVLVNVQPKTGKEMISGTVRLMAAQLGGADFISINDRHSNQGDKRIARNVMNILKEESHLDKTSNPLAGSYFMENLLDELTRKSWDVFIHIQQEGGYQAVIDKKVFFA